MDPLLLIAPSEGILAFHILLYPGHRQRMRESACLIGA